MKVKKILFGLFALGMLLSIIPLTGCSKDDDEELGDHGGSVLTVNGKKWEAQSLPTFDEEAFLFNCATGKIGHLLCFYEDLTDEDLEKGDDVSPYEVILPTENAKYIYEDGEVIVTKCSAKEVTLRFDNYKVKYSGKWESILGDNRSEDIIEARYLTINGTVKFYSH